MSPQHALFARATAAIAEQGILPKADRPQRSRRSDNRGVEGESCHVPVDPDQPVDIPGTIAEQNASFEAFDPVTGEATTAPGSGS